MELRLHALEVLEYRMGPEGKQPAAVDQVHVTYQLRGARNSILMLRLQGINLRSRILRSFRFTLRPLLTVRRVRLKPGTGEQVIVRLDQIHLNAERRKHHRASAQKRVPRLMGQVPRDPSGRLDLHESEADEIGIAQCLQP